MNWIKRNYAPLLIVVISSLVGIALMELTLRIVNLNNQWTKTREANILRNFKFNYDVSEFYQSDTNYAEYARNQYGLRDDCESPSEIEILTIGGSTTDQKYVSFTSTYQEILEEYLKDFDDSFGCVSNAGVDGHSTWGHLFSFEHWFPLIPGLNPKIIMLYIGVNDADFLRAFSPNKFDTKRTDGLKSFLKRFEIVNGILPIYRVVRQKSGNASAAYGGHVPRQYTQANYTVRIPNEQTDILSEQNSLAFHSRMEALLEEIHSLGATPLCVTQPHRFVKEKDGVIWGVENVFGDGFSGIDYDHSIRKLNNVIFELCGENTVDLYNHKFSYSHFYDAVHTTATGSEEIGKIVAEFIIKNFY